MGKPSPACNSGLRGGKIRGRNIPQLHVLRATLDQALDIQPRLLGRTMSRPCLGRADQSKNTIRLRMPGLVGQHVVGYGSENRPLLSGEPKEIDRAKDRG